MFLAIFFEEIMKNIKDYSELSAILGVKLGTFFSVLNQLKNNQGYSNFNILKKHGGMREISAPNSLIKFMQKNLKDYLQSHYNIHSCAMGFKSGSSNVLNASRHIKPNWCLNIDLKDFFPSINFGRVYGLFMAQPFCASKKIATALAILTCHNNTLPQGAPSSPLISNLIAFSLDNKLLALARENHCCYTRYADDITFSSNSKYIPKNIAIFDENVKKWYVGSELQKIVEENGFSVNNGKTRLLNKNQRQEVTGIVVNQKPNLPREYYRELRSIFHQIKTKGLIETAKRNHTIFNHCKDEQASNLISYINGKMAYYKTVVGESNNCYNNLCKAYNKLIDYKYKNCFYSKDELLENSIFVIEYPKKNRQGTAFLLKDIGLVTCKHCLDFTQTELCSGDEFLVNKTLAEKNVILFHSNNPDKHYKIKIKKVYQDYDLAILSIIDYDDKNVAFKMATDFLDVHTKNCTLLGYPNYTKGSTINETNNVQVVSRKKYMDMTFYCLDCSVISGNSGGPLINENNEVLAIACRGGEDIDSSNKTDLNGVIPIQVLTEK